MNERYKHLLNFGANLMTLAYEGLCFAFIWYTYYSEHIIMPFFRRGNWAVIGLYLLFIFFFTYNFGGYNIGYRRITDIVLSHILAILCSTVVAYFEVCMIARDYVKISHFVRIALLDIVFIIPWTFAIRKMYAALYPPRKLLVVYGDYSPDEFMTKINYRNDKYDICAAVDYRTDSDEMYKMITAYHGVILFDLPDEERNKLMKFCYRHSVRVYITPKISDILFRSADDIHLFDTPLYLSRNQGLSIVEEFFKRLFDIISSIAGIIIFSPILLLVAIAVKLYDGGPVLYKQSRLTKDGKVFMMYKFRSMRVNSEQNGICMTTKNDNRITPVGNIIRNIHVDELPQLINILKGDMSLVGPRPERPEIAAEYENEIPEFSFRLKVKAGLTGYAQVFGKYNTTPYDKLKLDLTYIENYNFWMDMKILLLTFKILFVKDSTEGIEEGSRTASRKNIRDK